MKKALLLSLCCLSLFQCSYQENSAQILKSETPFLESQFDRLVSNKSMGFNFEKGQFVFRVFAPRAKKVELALFRSATGRAFATYPMTRDKEGVWEYSTKKRLWNKYYGYYVHAQNDPGDIFNATTLIPDPYSKVVSTQNNYKINARTYICRSNFDWEEDKWIVPNDPRDLIVYEAQLRDLTADPSARVKAPGTYLGLIEKIPYLKRLGVNAIEFLPLQDFANIEIPFKDTSTALFNTWNPYARNHWGYMTTFFFAPENYYSSAGNMNFDEFIDDKGKSINEFKTLVKTLHKEGFSVLMDVVYNHTSTYDANPFKMIDKKYYYRLDDDNNFISKSGCGNDFKTERPMSRKMIVESVLYWMQEFHIDGFRFDLGSMIDDETLSEILKEAKKINPNVVIVAEPWGGGMYNPEHFSSLNWGSWNDRFRNGIKGQNPHTRPGFIFGKWDEGVSRSNIVRFLMGSLQSDGGQYLDAKHSVNYLEAHDDETFGDFVRIYLGKAKENVLIQDLEEHHILNEEEMKYHKLGAFILGSSQGMTMIHSGQEFGRSKVIEINEFDDEHQGMIDRNSYNKDNSTNYINYDIAKKNEELINFYSSIFRLRRLYPQLRKSNREDLEPFFADSEFGIGYHIMKSDSNEHEMLVLVNGSRDKSAFYNLPDGIWEKLFSTHSIEEKNAMNYITLEPSSGVILIKR